MMGDDGGTSASTADIAELRDTLKALQTSVQELREARDTGEKREAQKDVDEAREDLDAVAKRLGISKASLERAAAEARKSERKEELRPIIAELFEELVGDDDDEKDDEPDEKAAKKEKDEVAAKREQKEKEPPPVEDVPPVQEHWTDRKVKLW